MVLGRSRSYYIRSIQLVPNFRSIFVLAIWLFKMVLGRSRSYSIRSIQLVPNFSKYVGFLQTYHFLRKTFLTIGN